MTSKARAVISVLILIFALAGLTLLASVNWRIALGVLLCQWAQHMDDKLPGVATEIRRYRQGWDGTPDDGVEDLEDKETGE
jgi:hypothetical protein